MTSLKGKKKATEIELEEDGEGAEDSAGEHQDDDAWMQEDEEEQEEEQEEQEEEQEQEEEEEYEEQEEDEEPQDERDVVKSERLDTKVRYLPRKGRTINKRPCDSCYKRKKTCHVQDSTKARGACYECGKQKIKCVYSVCLSFFRDYNKTNEFIYLLDSNTQDTTKDGTQDRATFANKGHEWQGRTFQARDESVEAGR